ncbi:Transposase DDE domain protein [Pirellulimonas nuda]|uniref:Transposase DDE domain protein n=1 Tax=Pirellulimonas nuda TaxID=2528009 RepID=A0A518DBU3_9BACT|nr:IS5 family transposase [Pirellulimonas nuda]QDU88939.1 Transposase DDE domain protein [Pirellulimonas nuda]
MAGPLVRDELWTKIEPLISERPQGGRPPVDDRSALTGIVFVLKRGIPWEMLPQEMGCGSGMTWRRRARDWQEAGVWHRLHELLLAELSASEETDWSRVGSIAARFALWGGGEETGPNPTDRRKPGSKHHLATDGNGVPLQTELLAANSHDGKPTAALIAEIPPVRGKVGHPRSRPDVAFADRAYDDDANRLLLERLGIAPDIAHRGDEHGGGRGFYRWVVARTIAWLHHFKRLRIRFDRRADIHEGFLNLGKCLVCWNVLRRDSS